MYSTSPIIVREAKGCHMTHNLAASRRSEAGMCSGELAKIDFDAEQNKSGVAEARWTVFKKK